MESTTQPNSSHTLSTSQETWRMECEAPTRRSRKSSKDLPDQSVLLENFFYKDGSLFWKKNASTRRSIGSKVGWVGKDGYLGCGLDGKVYRVHRLIYKMHYGYCPEFLDHINGDPGDNRLENLRPATNQQNNANKKQLRNNKVGLKGVCMERGKYKASIKFNNRSMHLGYFDCPLKAHEAYNKKARELFGEYSWK